MNSTVNIQTEAEFRIYVASLSDYNNGHLHGAWIDCDGKDASELQDEVNKILRSSKFPNVTIECPDCEGEAGPINETDFISCKTCKNNGRIPSAEEYAIHDHEGFDDLISEHSSLDTVADIVDTLESADDADALKAFADCYGYDLKEAAEQFDDAYHGQWDSELDYAYEFIDQRGYLDGVPDTVAQYFNYEAFARDLFMDGYTFVDGYVFNDYH